MLTAISRKLSSFFISKGDITEEERETYDYCFEIFLSTVLNGVFLLAAGLISGKFIYTLLFMFSFILFRSVSGGFHANSHIKCFFTLVCVYAVFLCFLYFASQNILLVFSIVFTLSGSIMIYFLSPMEHPNNPLDDDLRDKLSKKAKWSTVVFSITVILFIVFTKYYTAVFCLTYGMFSVAVSIVSVKLLSSKKAEEKA